MALLLGRNKSVYLIDEEEEPVRSDKSKRFLPKFIFLRAVVRPRFDDDCEVLSDRKIGFWPFIETVLAKLNSRNQVSGTLSCAASR